MDKGVYGKSVCGRNEGTGRGNRNKERRIEVRSIKKEGR